MIKYPSVESLILHLCRLADKASIRVGLRPVNGQSEGSRRLPAAAYTEPAEVEHATVGVRGTEIRVDRPDAAAQHGIAVGYSHRPESLRYETTEMMNALNQLGSDGWELTGIEPDPEIITIWFKRPLEG